MGMLVLDTSPIITKQVSQSGLMDMEHLRLVHIKRDGEIVSQPQMLTTYIQVYDVLYVAGAPLIRRCSILALGRSVPV